MNFLRISLLTTLFLTLQVFVATAMENEINVKVIAIPLSKKYQEELQEKKEKNRKLEEDFLIINPSISAKQPSKSALKKGLSSQKKNVGHEDDLFYKFFIEADKKKSQIEDKFAVNESTQEKNRMINEFTFVEQSSDFEILTMNSIQKINDTDDKTILEQYKDFVTGKENSYKKTQMYLSTLLPFDKNKIDSQDIEKNLLQNTLSYSKLGEKKIPYNDAYEALGFENAKNNKNYLTITPQALDEQYTALKTEYSKIGDELSAEKVRQAHYLLSNPMSKKLYDAYLQGEEHIQMISDQFKNNYFIEDYDTVTNYLLCVEEIKTALNTKIAKINTKPQPQETSEEDLDLQAEIIKKRREDQKRQIRERKEEKISQSIENKNTANERQQQVKEGKEEILNNLPNMQAAENQPKNKITYSLFSLFAGLFKHQPKISSNIKIPGNIPFEQQKSKLRKHYNHGVLNVPTGLITNIPKRPSINNDLD